MLCLDIPTRWNAIYLMLSTIEKYKKKIEHYYLCINNGYTNSSSDNWKKAEVFMALLKTFYDATFNIFGSLYIIANVHFEEL